MDEKEYKIRISAETQYMNEQSFPEQERYVFAYTMTITNTGNMAATLLRRHWLITDANCNVQEVRGDGVIGEQPHLKPGESFEYTSAAILETPVGCMEGKYEMLAEDGIDFVASIPIFKLSTPNALH
ncbi:Co2+/Mg2+ efflux protein ApaG [Gammaproteobacteria bacterium]|mgnify:FL=1|jgi:ApaG protein|nr:Co2+/Mg2+ efflux protein ApaG [Gammaproteobacteria bacterium]|tara:strand:- start:491 stop:871 length:381 start_codon:yes stop_codon:yes gene_type:complete